MVWSFGSLRVSKADNEKRTGEYKHQIPVNLNTIMTVALYFEIGWFYVGFGFGNVL